MSNPLSGGNVPVRMRSTKTLGIKVIRGGKVYEFPPVAENRFSIAALKFWWAAKRWNYGSRKIQLKDWMKKK